MEFLEYIEDTISEIIENGTIDSTTFETSVDHNNNASSKPHFDIQTTPPEEIWKWTWSRSVRVAILTPVAISAILGNFLAIFSFITRNRQMRTATHFFIANLSLADLLVGTLCLPFLVVQTITDRWYFGSNFCVAYNVMHLWFCSASIFSTCAICVERYIGVKHPLSHMNIMSLRKVLFIILLIWIYGGAVTFFSILIQHEMQTLPSDDAPKSQSWECRGYNQLSHVVFATIFIFYIPAVLMCFLYWRIYRMATRHLKVMMRARKSELTQLSFNTTSLTDNEQRESMCSVLPDSDDQGLSSGNMELEKKFISKFEEMQSSGMRSPEGTRRETKVAVRSQRHVLLAKRLMLLVGVLLLSYGPYYTMFLVQAARPSEIGGMLFAFCKWMRYINSAINPYIYAFTVPAYRKAFKNIVCKGRLFK